MGVLGLIKGGESAISGTNPQNQYQNTVNTSLNPQLQAQQQAFVQQLQAQANGTGPSAATAMLQNQAAQNAAQANASAASMRGINPALAQRQAQESAAQQNAQANQTAAVARNQEQLGATQQLGSQLNTMQGQDLQNQLGDAQLNTTLATGAANNQASLVGGVIGGVGSAAGALAGLAHGGTVPGYDAGGSILPLPTIPLPTSGGQAMQKGMTSLGGGLGSLAAKGSGPQSAAGQMLAGGDVMAGGPMDQMGTDASLPQQPVFAAAHGGTVPVKLSPGEKVISPKEAAQVAAGKKDPKSVGQKVPGKAPVKGDSPKNDIVNAQATPGSIVVPRSIEEAHRYSAMAQAFIAGQMAKSGKLPKKGGK